MPKAGTKILMSGGTRCNVLPMEVDLQADFFTGGSTSAMRAVFASWPLAECKAWLEDADEGLGLPLSAEDATKKYFPESNSAKEVRDRLVAACSRLGVTFRYNASVESIAAFPLDAPVAEQSGGHASSAAAREHTHPGSAGRAESTSEEEDPAARSGARGPRKKGRGPRGVGGGGGGGEKGGVGASNTTTVPNGGWVCNLAGGERHTCDRLVIATGGLSFPKVGTDGTGHRFLRRLGLELRETYPALTPLTGTHPGGEQLAGLSLYTVAASVGGGRKAGGAAATAHRPDFLFTHKGFSGPSVLDLSHHFINALSAAATQAQQAQQAAQQGAQQAQQQGAGGSATAAVEDAPAMLLNWTGESAEAWDERLRAGGLPLVRTVLQRHGIRERLADALVQELGLAATKLSQLKGSDRAALVTALTAYPLRITGSEGFRKAEVTGGGLPLEALQCGTMESRTHQGLHLCGEVLDVFGRIGGFNFYWAWVSGRLAGLGAAHAADTRAVSRALREQKQLWAQWEENW